MIFWLGKNEIYTTQNVFSKNHGIFFIKDLSFKERKLICKSDHRFFEKTTKIVYK